MFDRNGVGHISTAELLNRLKAELPSKEYEQYAQIITGYGSTINYIDMVQKNRNKFWQNLHDLPFWMISFLYIYTILQSDKKIIISFKSVLFFLINTANSPFFEEELLCTTNLYFYKLLHF